MAIPVLYWMLECTGCKSRRVVHDSYLRLVGGPDGHKFGSGYEGTPLPERYRCTEGCSQPLEAVASIFRPDDREMRLHDTHEEVEMTAEQSAEWLHLIEKAGLPWGERPPERDHSSVVMAVVCVGLGALLIGVFFLAAFLLAK